MRHLIAALCCLGFVVSSAIAATPGAFDSPFGIGGVAQINFASAFDAGPGDDGYAVLIQPNGRALVAGQVRLITYVSGLARLNASGVLDSSFGQSATPGRALVYSNDGSSTVGRITYTVAQQSDGTPVFAGTDNEGGRSYAVVARCADPTCSSGSGGINPVPAVRIAFPPAFGNAYVYAIAVFPNDKIAVVGRADYVGGGCAGFAARLNPDLTPDSLFGISTYHVALVSFIESCSEFHGLALQANGNFVAVGKLSNASDTGRMLAARFDGGGNNALDFNGAQPLVFEIRSGNSNDGANAVALDSQGRIVIAGYSQFSANDYDYAITRLDRFGAFDSSFSGDGKQLVYWDIAGDKDDEAVGVAIDYADKPLVTGNYRAGTTQHDVGTVRLNVDGQIDPTYGVAGRSYAGTVTPSGAPANDIVRGIARDRSGRTYLVGTTDANAATVGSDYFVMRLYGDGIYADGYEW